MRLFVAIMFDASMKAALQRQMDFMRAAGLEGRFTAPDNLHLTLAFLGQTQRLEDAAACLSSVRASAFSLSLGTMGRFCRESGDIYYAAPAPNCHLSALAAQTAGALRTAGFALEDRPFIPHITLCRARPECRDFDFSRYLSAPVRGGMWADAITLLRSESVQSGVRYTPICRSALFSSKSAESASGAGNEKSSQME